MAYDLELEVKAEQITNKLSEIRLVVAGGGPAQPEVVFSFSNTGVRVSVWNPYDMEAHADGRPGEWEVIFDSQTPKGETDDV